MRRWPAFAIALLLPASLALADGDGPSRKMTGPEAAAYGALKRAVQEALPQAPANYALAFSDGSGSGEVQLPGSIKPDQMARLQFSAVYTLSPDYRAERQRSLFTDRATGTPEQQARLAALDAKDEQLRAAREATRDRGEKDRIRAEQKAVQKEANALRDQVMEAYTAWVAAGGANVALQESEQSLPARELTVRVLVNQDVSVNEKAAPFTLAGAPLAFELADGCEKYGDVCISVLLGPFVRDKDKRGTHWLYQLRGASPGVPTKPRGMAVVVAGPKGKAQAVRDLLAQVDLAKLRGLLP